MDIIFNGCGRNAKLQILNRHRATSGRSKAVNSCIIPQFFLPVARVQCFALDWQTNRTRRKTAAQLNAIHAVSSGHLLCVPGCFQLRHRNN